jgi:hypothetical protein
MDTYQVFGVLLFNHYFALIRWLKETKAGQIYQTEFLDFRSQRQTATTLI